jgi:hypothetical protein
MGPLSQDITKLIFEILLVKAPLDSAMMKILLLTLILTWLDPILTKVSFIPPCQKAKGQVGEMKRHQNLQ